MILFTCEDKSRPEIPDDANQSKFYLPKHRLCLPQQADNRYSKCSLLRKHENWGRKNCEFIDSLRRKGKLFVWVAKCAEIYDESKQISEIIFTSGAELEIEMQPNVLSRFFGSKKNQ